VTAYEKAVIKTTTELLKSDGHKDFIAFLYTSCMPLSTPSTQREEEKRKKKEKEKEKEKEREREKEFALEMAAELGELEGEVINTPLKKDMNFFSSPPSPLSPWKGRKRKAIYGQFDESLENEKPSLMKSGNFASFSFPSLFLFLSLPPFLSLLPFLLFLLFPPPF